MGLAELAALCSLLRTSAAASVEAVAAQALRGTELSAGGLPEGVLRLLEHSRAFCSPVLEPVRGGACNTQVDKWTSGQKRV